MMNQSFRITDKTLRISLVVGTILLAVTILVLSLAVGAARRREEAGTTAVTTQGALTTTAPSTPTHTTPSPSPVQQTLKLSKPVEGYLAVLHDMETLSFSNTMQDYRVHAGIDIEAESGAAVVAAAAGTISDAYVDPMMGYTIEIDHGNGYKTVYRNLDETLPEGIVKGATVLSGQLIGAVGDSALVEQADLPHLHFELIYQDEMIDPLVYLTYEERVEE